jgi:transcription elongation factor Elf1
VSKTKYDTLVCPSCGREAKMEKIGEVVGSENKVWYRCTRCRHSVLMDSVVKKADNILNFNREECIDYSPQNSYKVGSSIYHQDWDDMGKVTRKERTSSGGNAIWVDFQKNGEKRLIENLQAE